MAEVTARTSVPSDQRVESNRLNRAVEALREQEIFTRGQVAWLMSQAMRWGYELGVPAGYRNGHIDGQQACMDQWNAASAAQVATFNAQDVSDGLSRKWLREQCDTMARTPRPGDHLGGAVKWDDEPIPLERGRPDLRVAA